MTSNKQRIKKTVKQHIPKDWLTDLRIVYRIIMETVNAIKSTGIVNLVIITNNLKRRISTVAVKVYVGICIVTNTCFTIPFIICIKVVYAHIEKKRNCCQRFQDRDHFISCSPQSHPTKQPL